MHKGVPWKKALLWCWRSTKGAWSGFVGLAVQGQPAALRLTAACFDLEEGIDQQRKELGECPVIQFKHFVLPRQGRIMCDVAYAQDWHSSAVTVFGPVGRGGHQPLQGVTSSC